MAGRLALIWTLILAVFAQYEVAQDMMVPKQCGQPYAMITVKNDTLPDDTVFRLERDGLRIDFDAVVFEKLISCLQTDTTSKKCTFESSRVAIGPVYEYMVQAVLTTASGNTKIQQGQYYTCQVPRHSGPKEETVCTKTNSSSCFTDPMYCIVVNQQNTAQDNGKYRDVNIIWISETKEDLTASYDATYVTIESCQSYTASPSTTTTETTAKVGNNSMELTSSSEGTNNAGVIAGVICVLIVIAFLVVVAVFIWRRKRKAARSNSPDLTDTTYDRPQAAARVNSVNAYDTVDIGNAYSFQRKISDTPSNVYSLQRRSSEVSNNTYSLQQEANDTSNNAYSLQQEISDIPSNAYSLQKEVRDKRNNAYSLQQISDISNNNNVNENIESNNGEHKQHRKIRPRKNYHNVLPGEFQDSGGEASNTNSQNETAEIVNENQPQHEYSRLHENKRNIKNAYDQFLKPSEDLQESQSNPSPTNIVTESSTNQDLEDYSMALTIIDETTNENAEDKNSLNCETNAATDEEKQSSHEYSRLHENKRENTHPYDQLQKPNKDSQERQLNPAPTNITRESFSNEVSKDYSLAAPFVDETSIEKAEISII